MSRLVAFARSVIPRDPNQLFFLAGSILLLISLQLRCYPLLDFQPFGDLFRHAFQSWRLFAVTALSLVSLAGAAGLFLCFWPGTHPVRLILGFVMIPALTGIGFIAKRYLLVSQQPYFQRGSVLQHGSHNEAWGFNTVWSLGPAVHITVLGLALLLIFVARLATGNSSLPVSVAFVNDAGPGGAEMWERIRVFVWISTVGSLPLGIVASFSITSLYRLAGGSSGHPLSSPALYLLSAALATACLAGAAAWAVGKDRWNELRQFIRPAESKFVVLGVIFPIAIEFVPNLAGYSLDRMNWAASQLNSAAPPLFGWYFHIPRGYHFWYLLGAAWEEVIWRGYLQPRFVRRYGLIRGIFLLGLVWAAVHFTGDFRGSMRDSEVLIKLASRIAQCVAMS